MLYTESQVKALVLSFYKYLPKNPAHHNESILDAWFERYGNIIAERVDAQPSMEAKDTDQFTTPKG